MAGDFVVNLEAAIHRDGEWLLIERSAGMANGAGKLAMPGGTLEHTDEADGPLEAALRREVLEEVGVTLGPDLHYVESRRFWSAKGRWVLNVVFLGTLQSGEPRVVAPAEVAWTGWLPPDAATGDPRCPPWLATSLHLAEHCLHGI